jgi:molybdenum cofactor cytidylyltransferase
MHLLTSIAPIILAAGDSSRMGYPKALLPLGEDVFLTRILGTISRVGLADPIIVLGKAAPFIQAQISSLRASILINPDPSRGQLSSIQLALSSLTPAFKSGLIWPVDHPQVSESLVRNLAQLFLASGASIASPICRDKHGHPAIFHRSLFQEFMDAALEAGPKDILLRHKQVTVLLPTDESATVVDIDTPSDYRAITGESLESALARRAAPKRG